MHKTLKDKNCKITKKLAAKKVSNQKWLYTIKTPKLINLKTKRFKNIILNAFSKVYNDLNIKIFK